MDPSGFLHRTFEVQLRSLDIFSTKALGCILGWDSRVAHSGIPEMVGFGAWLGLGIWV